MKEEKSKKEKKRRGSKGYSTRENSEDVMKLSRMFEGLTVS